MPGPKLWVFRDALDITVYSLLNYFFLTHLMSTVPEFCEFYSLMKWFFFSQVDIYK